MGVVSLITGLLTALGKALGLVKQRDAELNTPAMQKNAAARTDAEIAQKAATDEASPTSDEFDKNTS